MVARVKEHAENFDNIVAAEDGVDAVVAMKSSVCFEGRVLVFVLDFVLPVLGWIQNWS